MDGVGGMCVVGGHLIFHCPKYAPRHLSPQHKSFPHPRRATSLGDTGAAADALARTAAAREGTAATTAAKRSGVALRDQKATGAASHKHLANTLLFASRNG